MRTRIYVKPAPGLKIRRPATEGGAMLDPKGELVQLDSYWQRRLKSGDVVPAPELADPEEKAADKSAAKTHKNKE